MDEIAEYNIKRWNTLADVNALFTRPAEQMDAAEARQVVDPEGLFGDLQGKKVLCLAAGGGKQSVAFTLLDAEVTMVDISDAQVARDNAAAQRFNLKITARQGDMRDLSFLDPAQFDLVWQPYALNFVPDPVVVFEQVARVLRPGGVYYFVSANPFILGLHPEDWDGKGYPLYAEYQDSAAQTNPDPDWVYERETYSTKPPPPREYRHTLSQLLNGLIAQGFALTHIADNRYMFPNYQAEPGSWDHFVAVAPPWIAFWASYKPR